MNAVDLMNQRSTFYEHSIQKATPSVASRIRRGALAAITASIVGHWMPTAALHSAPLGASCDAMATVGGGALGLSPGPVGPPNSLGWDVGTGQCNGSFVATAVGAFPGGSLELAMRGEQRRIGPVIRNGFSYEVQTGADVGPPAALNRAWWNFQGSVAYNGDISTLDALSLSIRTDVGPNPPASPVVDLLPLIAVINARNNEPNATSGFADLFQFSQNPEFGWFAPAPGDDTDGNPTGAFNYDAPGAWLMTLSATEAGVEASVAICIHTPGETCQPDVDLAMSLLSPVPDPVPAGDNLRYEGLAFNLGAANATDMQVTLLMPPTTGFVAVDAPGATGCTTPAVGGNGNVICTWPTTSPGDFEQIEVVVSVPNTTASGTTLEASASVIANEPDPVPINNASSVTSLTSTEADVQIRNVLDQPDPVVAGENLSLSFDAINAGPSVATNLTMRLAMDPGTKFLSLDAHKGATCTAPAVGDSGEVRCAWPETIEPFVDVRSLGVVVSVDSDFAGLIQTTVRADADQLEPDISNNAAGIGTLLSYVADLAISKTDGVESAPVGSVGSYSIVIANAGPSDAFFASVRDEFPPGFNPEAWTCSATAGSFCQPSGFGDIEANILITVGGVVTFVSTGTYSEDVGTVSNTALVTTESNVSDPNPLNNAAVDATLVVSPAQLTATKTVRGSFQLGGVVAYDIVIVNGGPQAQLDNAGPEFEDPLPAGFVYGGATASSGSLSYEPGSNTLSWSGALGSGESVAITITGSIDPAAAGATVSNQGRVLFDADGNGSNESVGLSDDPSVGGATDPTVIAVMQAQGVPTNSAWSLLLLMLGLGATGALLFRHKSVRA